MPDRGCHTRRVPDTRFLRRAACVGHPVDAFFPSADEGEPLERRDYLAGLTVCRDCPVRQPCLDYAMAEHIDEGAWGGLTPEERRSLRRRQARKAVAS